MKAGLKVAICEQVEIPNWLKVSQARCCRIITHGTAISDPLSRKKKNNYLVSVILMEEIRTCRSRHLHW